MLKAISCAPAHASVNLVLHLLQVRLYDPRCGAIIKGLLLPRADLPPCTIIAHLSMVKTPEPRVLQVWLEKQRQQHGQQQQGPQGGAAPGPGSGSSSEVARLEVVNHCEPGRESTVCLNRYLVALLHHGGVSEERLRR
jgi:hypothetical protein